MSLTLYLTSDDAKTVLKHFREQEKTGEIEAVKAIRGAIPDSQPAMGQNTGSQLGTDFTLYPDRSEPTEAPTSVGHPAVGELYRMQRG